ncbi:group I truncated hemoglobin [Granulosicoccus antarcticus]|uniref:Group 1 truncated hemoglobin GlbN n=1 Tax=Granulosicoccus antarcticus IMCC3135 TaxID=1192854 RepID=A0A2Z2NWC4_9GAMM|nr:group 1 truncated hemoglobin [Granulosicoccus antarcticus]ASJ71454.1 Group 1 truncated hemoglobin GlbN [Granulosicoccus antarcticus IMCC3135]
MQYTLADMIQVFRNSRTLTLLLLIALTPISACTLTTQRSAPTLYEELGGAAGVDTLTTDFIRKIAADERIKGRYRDSDIGRFHRMMGEQMCLLTGGGCTYTGDDMLRTHAGMKITRVEFTAIVEALMLAMDKNNIPQGTQNRLLELYAPMHNDIVDR